MDMSAEYIRMCGLAYFMQEDKKEYDLGDYFSYGGEVYIVNNYYLSDNYNTFRGVYFEEKEGDFHYSEFADDSEGRAQVVWLPRIDQLAEMIESWNKEISQAFFTNISINSKYRGIPAKGFNTLEKHLLCFAMYEKYKKQWKHCRWFNIE